MEDRILQARCGFTFRGISWARDSVYRRCTPEEVEILRDVPQYVIKITDKQGNVINIDASTEPLGGAEGVQVNRRRGRRRKPQRKEAPDAHKGNKPGKARGGGKGRK